MVHFETLLAEYYEWLGFFVRRNTFVGKREKGGWDMELDIVAFCPRTTRVLHVEPSLDAYSWETRQRRFRKKFEAGRRHIIPSLFQWLPADTAILQQAIVPSVGKDRTFIDGVEIRTVDEVIGEIKHQVSCKGIASRSAIPETFPLLRTIQFTVCGYNRLVEWTPPVPATAAHPKSLAPRRK